MLLAFSVHQFPLSPCFSLVSLRSDSISCNSSDIDLKELAETLPVSGLVLLDDNSDVPLLLLEDLSVILVVMLPVHGELRLELKNSLVVVIRDSGCNLEGCEPLDDSCSSQRLLASLHQCSWSVGCLFIRESTDPGWWHQISFSLSCFY